MPGWESQWALKCQQCGEYHYFVGGFHCVNRMPGVPPLPLDDLRKLLAGKDDEAIYGAIVAAVENRHRGYSRAS